MFVKRMWLVAFSAVSLVMFAATTAKADSKEEVREAIQKALNSMDMAIENKDFSTFFNFHTRDYIGIDKEGKRESLEEFRQSLPQSLADRNIRSLSNMTTIENVSLDGDTAEVSTRSRSIITSVDATIIETKSQERETWVKRNGKWLRKQSQTITSETTVDGKPMETTETQINRKGEMPLGMYRVERDAQLRSEPRANASIVAEVPRGTKIRVVSQTGSYLEVNSRQGRTPGYISQRDVVFLGDQ